MNRHINALDDFRVALPPAGRQIGARLSAAGRGVWSALHRMGQRRAASHLRALAARQSHIDAALARQYRQLADECEAAANDAGVRADESGRSS